MGIYEHGLDHIRIHGNVGLVQGALLQGNVGGDGGDGVDLMHSKWAPL